VWNTTGDTLNFIIPPTFYQTIWFRCLVAIAVACALWVFYTQRLRKATAEVSARLGERLQERERIARELHDTLLQDLQAVILRFQLVANRLAKEDPNRGAMESGLDYADKVLAEGRDQIRGIRADTKAMDELSKSLAAYGEELAQLRPLSFQLTVIGKQCDLYPVVRDEIYRISREALGNAFKHSNGSVVEVEIGYLAAEFRIRVSDDGDGIDPDVADRGRPGHSGIHNMQERARKIGAVLKILSRPNNGTSVELTIPLELARERHAFWSFWGRKNGLRNTSLP
jgi:signal transduction histidine kinase